MTMAPPSHPPLDREEYIEQAYFFQTFRERLADNRPSQEILRTVDEEILTTTKLPLAIGFLVAELERKGLMGEAMGRLEHYFAPFQAFVIQRAEADHSRFELATALLVLEREARYRAAQLENGTDGPPPSTAGLFVYQFEVISRNQLGYDPGLRAAAGDPLLLADPLRDTWATWVNRIRPQLGTVDFSELVYRRSEQHVLDVRRHNADPDYEPAAPPLFGVQEGRIAKASRGRDPLYMFAALQRQLGYPTVPRTERKPREQELDPAIEMRFQRLEAKLAMLDTEMKGGIDLSEFYKPPDG